MIRTVAPLVALALIGCSGNVPDGRSSSSQEGGAAAQDTASASAAAVEPPAPAQPQPSASPAAEHAPASRGAAETEDSKGPDEVARRYVQLVRSGNESQALRLWWHGAEGKRGEEAAIAAGVAAQGAETSVGKPADPEGAAGSIYVEVPITIRGVDGKERKGSLVLRRVNDVPGSTAEQRRWHIYSGSFAAKP